MAGAFVLAARRRHRDRQHQLAVGKAEHHAVQHQSREARAKASPPRPRRARPHSRRSAARAPGRNCARTVECSPSAPTSRSPSAREPSSNTALTLLAVLLDPGQRLAAGIAGVRQRLPQRTPDARPGAGDGAHRQFVDDARRRGRGRRAPRRRSRAKRRRQARSGASPRTVLRACRCRCRGRRGRPRRARTPRRPSRCCRSRWAANSPPTEPPITNARGRVKRPLHHFESAMMTIRSARASAVDRERRG